MQKEAWGNNHYHGNRRSDVVKMVPRGLEPRTLRLLAVRSNQLSYETVGDFGSVPNATMKHLGHARTIVLELVLGEP